MNHVPLPPEPKRARTAARRNIPAAIGLGCFSLLVLGGLCFLGIFAVVSVALRSSDAYALAVSAAQRDPSVVAALGSPVKPGWFTSGQIDVDGAGGRATLSIPVSGPHGSGTLNARATKTGGKWSLIALTAHVAGRSPDLDLLVAKPAP